MNPSFGILLCTYNGEKYLPKQLQSFLDQDQQVDEIVAIDDGSTDGTVEILKLFSSKFKCSFRIIEREKNLGPSMNFLLGLKEMTSDWTLFSDQDDIWYSNKISTLAAATKEYPAADMIFSNVDLIDHADNLVGVDFWSSIGFDQDQQYKFTQDNLSRIIIKPLILGMAIAVKTQSAIQIPLPTHTILHDEWIGYHFALNNKIFLQKTVLGGYRQHNQQLTGVRNSFRFRNFLFNFFNKNTGPSSDLQRINFLQEFITKNSTSSFHQNIAKDLKTHLSIRYNGELWHKIKELKNGRYHKYSAGTWSFLKDLKINKR